ncbi:MAG: hypothetical protein ABIJ39_00305 [Chloroflexota bacterium]
MSNEINQQENLKAWARRISDDFTKGKSLSEVIAYLVRSGWTEESAREFAGSIAQR